MRCPAEDRIGAIKGLGYLSRPFLSRARVSLLKDNPHHQLACSHDPFFLIIMSDTTRFIPEHRRQQYKGKNQFRPDELRRRREDQQVEIRKQKKEENLAKRRNLDTKIQEYDPSQGETSESDDENGALNRKVCLLLACLMIDIGRVSTDGSGCLFE
jgi:hypothetical protein